MKITHLLNMLLTLIPILGAAPITRTVEPPNTLNDADAAELLPSDFVVDKPVEPQDGPFGFAQSRSFNVLSTFSASSAIQSHASNWHIECVDCPKEFRDLTNRILRVDSKGHPHVAYGGDHLYYAWHDGARWHYETVDESPGAGGAASLVLDSADQPHISYSGGGVNYAWRNEEGWHIETVDVSGAEYTSLVLDNLGRPHISYWQGGLFAFLKYAWYDGATWRIEEIDTAGYPNWGLTISLALDQMDQPRVAYSSSGSAYYAWRGGEVWQIEELGDGSSSSLALDEAGRPHIVYNAGVLLQHTWHDGTTWQVETVDSGGVAPSLELDSSNRPHVSYYDQDDHVVKYAWRDETGWQVKTVSSEVLNEYLWKYTSLALDGSDQPHVGYGGYKDSHFEIKYARYDGANWQVETVDSGDIQSVGMDVGTYTSLALDSLHQPHISYRGDGGLRYAKYDGIEWRVEAVDSEVYVDWGTSLALDALDRPHISYCGCEAWDGECDDWDLKYAWYDGTIWYTETVDSEGNVGYYPSLALDGAGRPHISYQAGYPDYDLKYAWLDGEDWHIETVDSEGWVGEHTSLALDELGQPHISYESNDGLKYVWYDGAAWYTETVDSRGRYSPTGKGDTSLALDGSDQPHISYYYCGSLQGSSCSAMDLNYAWYDGASWQIETVDSEGNVGEYISLALDGSDRPHISYYSGDVGDLKYAWRDETGWHIETVDDEGEAGEYISLALDGAGQPHISYYHETTNDLKYAWRVFLEKKVTPDERLHNNDTLTYTLTLFGPGLNVRVLDPLPDTVHYVPGSITGTVTLPAVYSPTAQSIIWQGALPTDTVQEIRFQVTPDITVTRSLSSPLPVTNTAWLTDTENGKTISAAATVNLTPIPFSLHKQATPRDGLRNNDTLTYTLTISGPGLSIRLWDPLPEAVHYISDSVTGTITPTAVYSPTIHAVIWQGTLPTDTVQIVHFQVTPGITGTGSLSLSQPIVNTAWLTDTESGRGVSATVIVNGYHVYLPCVLK